MHRRLVISVITAALCGTTLAGTATSASAAPQAVDCRKVKCVALTFDDGPVADTQRLLRILNDHKVRATFTPSARTSRGTRRRCVPRRSPATR